MTELLKNILEWFKDGPFWRHPKSSNAGDLIFNTCDKILRDGDKSEWAHSALMACFELLKARLRWPDRLDKEHTADTWIQWKWYKWGFGKKVYSRPQHVMTRDPYIAFYAVCVFLGRRDLISQVNVPINCFSPGFYIYRKYLITHNDIYLKCYRFIKLFTFSKKDFVKRLDELREYAIVNLKRCKYIKREGESCTLNNNCKYPNCPV